LISKWSISRGKLKKNWIFKREYQVFDE
jgi:hypothetical protein